MTILAIETTGIVCGAAVHDGSTVVAEVHTAQARVHDAVLTGQVAHVCAQAGVAVRRLDAVACSIGPGSFTGIRIGLALAKGLCMSAGIPLIAIPTLDAMAFAARAEAARRGAEGIVPTVSAGGGKMYWAHYSANATRLGEYQTGTFDRSSRLPEHLVIGEAGTYFGVSGTGDPAGELHVPLPAQIASLGAEYVRLGRLAEPSEVQPLYVTPVSHRTVEEQGKP